MHRLGRLILVLLFAGLTGCGRPALHQQESFVFGTRVEVLVADADEATARRATDAVLREFDRLHRTYHAWLPSELSTLNAAIAAGKPIEVSDEMAAILKDAQRIAALGEGLFVHGELDGVTHGDLGDRHGARQRVQRSHLDRGPGGVHA